MPRTRYTEEQIGFALRQVEAGTPVEAIRRKLGVVEATFYALAEEIRRAGGRRDPPPEAAEDENRRLKQLVADLTLDKAMRQDALRRR